MNHPKITFSVLFTLAAFAALINAQPKSLKMMPASEKFTSVDGGFTMAMPKDTNSTEPTNKPDERGNTFGWELVEGNVFVTYGEYTDGTSIKSAIDIKHFLDGFKQALVKTEGLKLTAETPWSVGAFSGMNYALVFAGRKSESRVIISGNRYYSMMAMADTAVPGADVLLFKALDSFRLTGTKQVRTPVATGR